MRSSLFYHLLARNGVFQENVLVLSNPAESVLFEENYSAVRQVENRHYSDRELLDLPEIREDHPHAEEWALRKHTCSKLKTFLERKRRLLTILDLGCGNGWMSNSLTSLKGAIVCAVDLNMAEIDQGARVFSENLQLQFCYANIFNPVFYPESFDQIILSSVIQYFPNIKHLLYRLRELLTADGEIHIVDSNLYRKKTIFSARLRSQQYYEDLGFPNMAKFYHHHLMSDLKAFSPRIMYHPQRLSHRLFDKSEKRSPFPWICIPSR